MRLSLSAGAAALATALALLLVTASAASAGVSISSSLTVPAAPGVGQQNLAGSFTVSNTNTPPQNTESNTVTAMRLAMSCGAASTVANLCPQPDTGVFAVDSPATGTGSACSGSTFTVSAPDASGIVTFTRVGGAPVLAPPGGNSSCTVNFTFDVLKLPTIDVDPAVGVQTRTNLLVTAQSSPSALVVSNRPSLVITVTKGTPTLATDASDGVVGQPITDTATLTSGVPVTGTVTFNLYGPSDATCSAPAIFTSPNRPINGSGVATSTGYVPAATGQYRWRATYNGDANHLPITGLCNAANETSFVTAAPPPAETSGTSVRGDFNGDGTADLVIGAPGEDLGAITDAGVVHVLYGGPGGASAAGSDYWSQNSPSIPDSAESGDRFGAVLSAGDFDGDGFADLAIGVPMEDVGAALDAGMVNVIYGSATGLTSANAQVWSQDSGAIAETGEVGDHFGSALAVGTFDNDAFADLAIGVPDESVGAVADAGLVHVVRGAAAGLTGAGSQFWTQDSGAIVDVAEDGDGFGSSLAVGYMNNTAGQDLAIGVPAEDVGAVVNGGVVHVLYGSAAGLAAAGAQLWSQDSGLIGDSTEAGDEFGDALAVGRLDSSDPFGDLVVGVPDENVGAVGDAGLVHVIRGAAAGLTGTGSQLWTQDSGAIVDSVETSDGFGAALAVGDLNSAFGQDLAIGVPAENVGAVADGGVVHVLFGSAAGPTAAGSQYWSQDAPGIADTTEAGDRFGSALAATTSDLVPGRLNGDAFGELVVGVPNESVGAVAGAGLVHVIAGAAGGPTAAGSQFWTQNSGGIVDSAEAGDGFGSAVGA